MKKIKFTTNTYLFVAVFILLIGIISMQIFVKIQLDNIDNRIRNLNTYCASLSSDLAVATTHISGLTHRVDVLEADDQTTNMMALQDRVAKVESDLTAMRSDLIARIESIDIISDADRYVCQVFGACGGQ